MPFDRDSWLIEVGDRIADAVDRRDSQHAVFHGCYDWHSAVHGHWALLRIAHVTGENRFAERSTFDFLRDKLAAEAKLLRDRPRFEMPYGRAWFLRLAIEHARVIRDARLRRMADEIAASLVAYYTTVAPSPKTREYSCDAWALVQLAGYAATIDDRDLAATVQRHVELRFLDAGGVPGFELDRTRPDFFSPRAAWLYLLATTQPTATLTRALADAALDDQVLAPIDPIQPVAHHFGINWSRAWMLHRLALLHPDEVLYRRAYDAHVEVGLRDHERGVGDYLAYDHWVPQFAVYALTEDRARES